MLEIEKKSEVVCFLQFTVLFTVQKAVIYYLMKY